MTDKVTQNKTKDLPQSVRSREYDLRKVHIGIEDRPMESEIKILKIKKLNYKIIK
jgi:hypothetical protein